jgi:SAM-dependent methyltransferase/glycosyltransferase involved in cell wall biosynthesis
MKLGIAVQLEDFPWATAPMPDGLGEAWFSGLNANVGADVVLHICMPVEVIPEPGKLNVNFTTFEATPAPPEWVARNREHDLLIVPSESSRQAWIAGGMPAGRIALCPLGVDAALYGRPAPSTPLPWKTAEGRPVASFGTRLLNISEVTVRKNLGGLLGAWLQATRPNDDAVLVLKWTSPYGASWVRRFIDRLQINVEQTVGRRFADAAPLCVVDQIYADADMLRVYASASHYLSLSLGEGWDFPMMEAGASGLKLIAPNHSAYPAYLDAAGATLIPASAIPADARGWGAMPESVFAGTTWWEPDHAIAVAAIRDAIDGRETGREPPRERLLRDFSWERATRTLVAILDEALGRATVPARTALPASTASDASDAGRSIVRAWLARYDRDYAPRLGRRAETFRAAFSHILADGGPVQILETGCTRMADNWDGDGQSTLLFDDLVNAVGGGVWSVDLSPAAVAFASVQTGPRTRVVQADSVAWLSNFATESPELLFDLVYLDSFDIDWTNPHPSALHHLQEFVHAWRLLRPGGVLVIDDDLRPDCGKGMYVRDHLARLGIEPLFSGYQIGWVKPAKPSDAAAWPVERPAARPIRDATA